MKAKTLLVSCTIVLGTVAGLVAGGDPWTAAELNELRSLALTELGPVPPDPTNRVADDPRAAALGERLFFDRRLTRMGDAAIFARVEPLGERAFALYDQPDAGLWEFRGRTEVHTYSSVMCWAACDRLARIAVHLKLPDRCKFWRDRADLMHARIVEHAYHDELGHFVEALDGHRLDASLLLLSDLGFVKADDPRFVRTVDAIGQNLRRGDALFRYVAPDDFGSPETSFTICTFWYIDALASIGRQEEARILFERILARRNPLGLLSEDLEFDGGEAWGNFPQTYSHVGLINAAMRLSRPWADAV